MREAGPVTTHALSHFAAKLRFETDPADVAATRAAGEPLVLRSVDPLTAPVPADAT